MSRTRKDRPWHLGGDRHAWVTVSNHGAHAKFTTAMRRKRRREENLVVKMGEEKPSPRSRWRYEYFD
mgnify:CR=1 FL=1